MVWNSDQSSEHLNELLLEFDLTVNQLSEHANETEDAELFQLCTEIQNNLEAFQDMSPSRKQIELLCAWPTHIRKFLTSRTDLEVKELLSIFLYDSNWPLASNYQEAEISNSSQLQVEQ